MGKGKPFEEENLVSAGLRAGHDAAAGPCSVRCLSGANPVGIIDCTAAAPLLKTGPNIQFSLTTRLWFSVTFGHWPASGNHPISWRSAGVPWCRSACKTWWHVSLSDWGDHSGTPLTRPREPVVCTRNWRTLSFPFLFVWPARFLLLPNFCGCVSVREWTVPLVQLLW